MANDDTDDDGDRNSQDNNVFNAKTRVSFSVAVKCYMFMKSKCDTNDYDKITQSMAHFPKTK